MRERRRNRYGMAWRKTFVRQVCSTWPKPVVQVMMRPSASGRSSWFVMNMEIVRSRSGFRNKVPGGFIEVHGFREQIEIHHQEKMAQDERHHREIIEQKERHHQELLEQNERHHYEKMLLLCQELITECEEYFQITDSAESVQNSSDTAQAKLPDED